MPACCVQTQTLHYINNRGVKVNQKRQRAAQAKKARKESRFNLIGKSKYQEKKARFGKIGIKNPRSPFYKKEKK